MNDLLVDPADLGRLVRDIRQSRHIPQVNCTYADLQLVLLTRLKRGLTRDDLKGTQNCIRPRLRVITVRSQRPPGINYRNSLNHGSLREERDPTHIHRQ